MYIQVIPHHCHTMIWYVGAHATVWLWSKCHTTVSPIAICDSSATLKFYSCHIEYTCIPKYALQVINYIIAFPIFVHQTESLLLPKCMKTPSSRTTQLMGQILQWLQLRREKRLMKLVFNNASDRNKVCV